MPEFCWHDHSRFREIIVSYNDKTQKESTILYFLCFHFGNIIPSPFIMDMKSMFRQNILCSDSNMHQ